MIAAMRHAAPIVVLAALAMSPVLFVAAHAAPAPDLAHARAQLALGWGLAATAWAGQLGLVAGVAPLVRGDASSALGALGAGVRGLVRAVVPGLIALVAIALGLAALVVPGLVLIVLLAPLGASGKLAEPPPAPLLDAVALARRDLVRIALIVGLAIALDLAIAGAAHAALVGRLPAKPSPAALHRARTFVRVVALAVSALAPVPAWLVARASKA